MTSYDSNCVQIFDLTTRKYKDTIGKLDSNIKECTGKIKELCGPSGVDLSYSDFDSNFNNLIYVCNFSKQIVQVFNYIDMDFKFVLGKINERGNGNYDFHGPIAVAISSTFNHNRIYVVDYHNHRVQVFEGKTLQYIKTLGTTGEIGVSKDHFNYPTDITISGDRIYVCDSKNFRVQVFVFDIINQTYHFVGTLGTTGLKGISNSMFDCPSGVAISDANNHIYVSDNHNHRVQVFDRMTLNYIATIGTPGISGTSKMQFNNPICISVSPIDNHIYVVDSFNNRVQVFDLSNLFSSNSINEYSKAGGSRKKILKKN